MEATSSNLQAAKLAVMEEVRKAIKDKKMTAGGNYQYVSIEGVLDQLRPVMVRNGLTLTPTGYKVVTTDTITTSHGKPMQHVVVEGSFKLAHVTGESEPVGAVGEGSDTMDKACNKAMTAAYKYAYLQCFALQAGHDDPDHYGSYREEPEDRPEPKNEPPTKPKALDDAIKAMIRKAYQALPARTPGKVVLEAAERVLGQHFGGEVEPMTAAKPWAALAWVGVEIRRAASNDDCDYCQALLEKVCAGYPIPANWKEVVHVELDAKRKEIQAKGPDPVDLGRKKFAELLKPLTAMHDNQPAELLDKAYPSLPADKRDYELLVCRCRWLAHFIPLAKEEDDLEYIQDRVTALKGKLDSAWTAKLEQAVVERRKAIQAQERVPA